MGILLTAKSHACADDAIVLPDPDPNPPNSIGPTVALLPGRMIAGIPDHRSLTSSKLFSAWGGLLVWQRSDGGVPIGSPSLVLPIDPKRTERFGESLASNGSLLAVGSPGFDATSSIRASGRVHLFDTSGAALALLATLTPTATENGREFGSSIAIDASGGAPRVLIGSPGWRDVGTLSSDPIGNVTMFTGAGSVWTETATITSPLPANARFAHAIAVGAGQALVAAPGGSAEASISFGRVLAWSLSNVAATPIEITPSTSIAGDRFGWSLATAGTLLAVGASADECDVGAVHLFRFTGQHWNEEATLTPPANSIDDWRGFGNSVALSASGDAVVIGSGGISNVTDSFGHRVVVFRRVGTTWMLVANVSGGDAAVPSGTAVAIDPDGFAFADPATGVGSIVFHPLDLPSLVGDLDGDGAVGATDLAILLGSWGPAPPGTAADLTGDGNVGADDLAILLGAWSGVAGGVR